MNKKTNQIYLAGTLFFFFLLYLFFPARYSTMDGIGYAADAKWGNDLFSPHHLLYTFSLWICGHFARVIGWTDIDYLLLGKEMNAVFAVASLWVLWRILQFQNPHFRRNLGLLMLVGSSFGVMRFATENETYIVPIFFSLVGQYYFTRYLSKENNPDLFFSGWWLSVSCLFHQIHFFWWLGIGCYVVFKSWKAGMVYGITAFIVPVVYGWVLVFVEGQTLTYSHFQHFIFSDFHTGTAGLTANILGLARFMVNLVRTFIQFHGTTYYWVKAFPWLVIFGVFSLLVVLASLWKKKAGKFPYRTLLHRQSAATLFVLFLQLAFAFLSMGNSEFMVMVPFLLAILLGNITWPQEHFIYSISLAMWTWNMVYGLIPGRFVRFSADEYWKEAAIKNQDAHFYMTRYGEIANSVYAETGKEKNNVYYSNPESASFKKQIDSLLHNKIPLFTNCVGNRSYLNTESVLMQQAQEQFYGKYQLVKIDSVDIFQGKEYLYQIMPGN